MGWVTDPEFPGHAKDREKQELAITLEPLSVGEELHKAQSFGKQIEKPLKAEMLGTFQLGKSDYHATICLMLLQKSLQN